MPNKKNSKGDSNLSNSTYNSEQEVEKDLDKTKDKLNSDHSICQDEDETKSPLITKRSEDNVNSSYFVEKIQKIFVRFSALNTMSEMMLKSFISPMQKAVILPQDYKRSSAMLSNVIKSLKSKSKKSKKQAYLYPTSKISGTGEKSGYHSSFQQSTLSLSNPGRKSSKLHRRKPVSESGRESAYLANISPLLCERLSTLGYDPEDRYRNSMEFIRRRVYEAESHVHENNTNEEKFDDPTSKVLPFLSPLPPLITPPRNQHPELGFFLPIFHDGPLSIPTESLKHYFDREQIQQLLDSKAYTLLLFYLLKLLSECENGVDKFNINFYIGVTFLKAQMYPEAIEYLRDSELLLNDSMLDPYLLITNISTIYVHMGDAYKACGNNRAAIECYGKSISSHQGKRDEPASNCYIPVALIHMKSSNASRADNQISKSVKDLEGPLSSSEELSAEDSCSCHSSLGNAFHNAGDYDSAAKEYKEAIDIAESSDLVSLTWLHGNLGNVMISIGKKDKGIHHLKKALNLTLAHDCTPSSLSRALNNLGTGYQAVGDLKTAEEYFDQALCQAIYGEDLVGQARAYGNIGNICMARKDYERAIPHYAEVLNLCDDRSVKHVAHHNRGCAYYELAEQKRIKQDGLEFQSRGCGPHVQFQEFTKEPESILSLYKRALKDLDLVIEKNEQSFTGEEVAKGCLDLFVCMFESNAKTFSRAQDCAYSIGDHHKAMLIAEQCRSRTLGELLLKRKASSLHKKLFSPIALDQIVDIMRLQQPNVPVVMLSWTGNRLLGWVLLHDGKEVSMDTFEQEVSQEAFDGSSLDNYLRYSLNRVLSDELEVYDEQNDHQPSAMPAEIEQSGMSESDKKAKEMAEFSPAVKLFKLVGEPIKAILATAEKASGIATNKRNFILIPDSTLKLIPYAALCDENDSTSTFGDDYNITFMPSLLTLGIMSQTPSMVMSIPCDDNDTCIVGDPTTPSFSIDQHEWSLGPLPHSKEEAESVGYYMKSKPLLHHEPTKSVVMSRLETAKLIHIAAHGSAARNFLVLAGATFDMRTTLDIKVSKGMVQDAKDLLLYASDVASLSLKAGLVVLSSCDSGRGVIKGDDIQGMARAFLLAGAQSVMTSLWKVPDKSARFFMQFFYRYLLDGHTSSEALSKASCSIRAFDEFSSMIHWSGYQITGKDTSVQQTLSEEERIARKMFGRRCSPFPRLNIIKEFKEAIITNKLSDIQVVCGSSDACLIEPIVDFAVENSGHFPGGLVFINACNEELLIKQWTMLQNVLATDTPTLIVVDNHNSKLLEQSLELVEEYTKASVIMTLPCESGKQYDAQIARRRLITSHEVSPLSELEVAQRLVYKIQYSHHLTPGRDEQKALSFLGSMCFGSPVITDIMSSLIDKCIVKLDDPCAGVRQAKESFVVSLGPVVESHTPTCFSTSIILALVQCLKSEGFLSLSSQVLLNCISIFGTLPIPQSFVEAIAEEVLACSSNQEKLLSNEVWDALCSLNLLVRYPSPSSLSSLTSNLYIIPEIIAESINDEFVNDPTGIALCVGLIIRGIQRLLSILISSSSQHSADSMYAIELLQSVKKMLPLKMYQEEEIEVLGCILAQIEA